ncbi:hypothetical protein Zmor_009519 [Zophobas morio]|uniref:Uncharacterized protein n=1 Tax=Zophobas morio TaxID=2755281 RepID=A0AA38IJ97_9CUCU|nr:hypothetical protein Zmor_009519 [Zophobas morio]
MANGTHGCRIVVLWRRSLTTNPQGSHLKLFTIIIRISYGSSEASRSRSPYELSPPSAICQRIIGRCTPPPVIFRRKSAMTRRRHHLSPFSAPIDPTSSARGGAGAARRAVRTCLERERSPGHVSSRPVSATPLFTVAGLGGQEFQP